jgi:hypothetical protein
MNYFSGIAFCNNPNNIQPLHVCKKKKKKKNKEVKESMQKNLEKKNIKT